MMKREKRVCRVARCHPLTDLEAIEDDLLGFEVHEDQRSLIKKMQKMQRIKSCLHFFLVLASVVTGSVLPGLKSGFSQNNFNSFAHPFSNLDPGLIPSGILHNRSPWYHNCFLFDTLSFSMVQNPDWQSSPYLFQGGTISMKSGTFIQLYKDMLASQINDSVLISPVEYQAAWDQAVSANDISLSLMAVAFERLPEEALLAGRVWLDTATGLLGPYPDTVWLPDTIVAIDTTIIADSTRFLTVNNPDSLLSISFEKYLLYGSRTTSEILFLEDTSIAIKFCVPSNLFITNIDTLSDVLIDFDDTCGFRLVPWDTQVVVIYNLPPQPKIQTRKIKVKLPRLNFDMIFEHTLQFVIKTIYPDTVIITDSLPFSCQPLTGSSPAEGRISVLFADTTDKQLFKPVLFVEGFETALQPYGDITFINVVNEIMPSLGFSELAELPLLFNTLLSNGYDLVYLDFKNSRDSIGCNMLAVIKTIQWINSELQKNGSGEKLVVAAASMGGVLARYALRKMELDGCCHNTRLYASFDAPHLGANIPIGMQHLVKQAAEVSKSWKGATGIVSWFINSAQNNALINPGMEESYEYILNSPAARALLITHVDPDAISYHKSFYNMLDSIGYPNYCRNIALINGSENGVLHKLEDPGERLLGTGEVIRFPYKWTLFGTGFNAPLLQAYYPMVMTDHYFAYSLVKAESKPFCYESNDWGASINNINTSITKIMWHTSLNHIYGGLALAVGPGEPLTYFYLDGLIEDNKNTGNKALAGLLAPGAINQYPSAGMLPLTTAPGGLNDALKKLGDAADKNIKIYSNRFSFVPSVSALGVKGVGLDHNLKDTYMDNLFGFTPFDSYWAPKRFNLVENDDNQMHVMITEFNRAWLLDHIDSDWELGTNINRYHGILSGTYNYGKPGSIQNIISMNQPFQKILYSLDIVQGGILYVNRQAEIGFQGSMLFPNPQSTFHLLSDGDPCAPSHVKIMQGGEMVLGDPLNYNNAIVVFNPNTILELFPGSRLTLHHSSRLTIADGATLIVHPGAEIVLSDTGSVLEMQGRLVLADNAQLAPSGLGYLRYNAPMTATTHHLFFVTGNGSSINLQGTGREDRKLDIASDTWFPSFLPVSISDARVTIAGEKTLAVNGPVNLNNLWVRPFDTTDYYRAFILHGQPGISVSNCLFSHGYYGVRANLAIGGTPLVLDDCEFRGNFTGLYTVDESVRLNRCLLHNNILAGWLAENMAGQSVADSSVFSMNGQEGIHFSGQINASLIISSSYIEQNLNGIRISDGVLQAACSHIADNIYTGILAESKARLKLGNMTKNHITGNYIGIALNKALEINIMNGYHKFSGNDYYIIGELMPNLYLNVQQNTLNPVNISGNHMPVVNNAVPVNIYIEHPVMFTTLTLPVTFSNNVNHLFTNCIQAPHINEHLLAPVVGIAGVSVVPGGRYTNYVFADALYQAAMNVSCEGYPGNDTLAISALSDLLDNLPPLMNDAEREGVDYGLELMTTALGNAIADGLVDPNRGVEGVTPDMYVGMIEQKIQQSLDDVDSQQLFAEEQEARYALMMAQMFRVAEHYDYALDILEDEAVFTGTTYGDDAAYWGCVCDAEGLMLKDSIDRTAFRERLDSCSLHLSNARLQPFVPVVGEINADFLQEMPPLVERIYPNPATNRIVVELNHNAGYVQVDLCDMTGRKLFEGKPVECVKEFAIDLPGLNPGVYMLKINADGTLSMHKLSICEKNK